MLYFKRRCFLFSVIGCLLFLTLFIVFADDASNSTSPLVLSQPGSQEVLEARTEYSKTFKNADGTTSICGSMLPMHYKDEKEKWQDIDTTIEDGTGDKDDDGAAYGYQSKKNSFQIYLPAFSAGWTSLRSGISQ
jgi:hypothetical protein